MAKKQLTIEEKLEAALVPVEEQPYKVPENWCWVKFSVTYDNVSSSRNKIKQKDYQNEGEFAIVDQGENLIGGYSNDEDMVYDGGLPVIIFGDHTRRIKYVNFPFIQGADGVKVLQPKAYIVPRYYYFCLQSMEIPHMGYRRHFPILNKMGFPVAPIAEQSRIVARIESFFTKLDEAKEKIQEVLDGADLRRAAILHQAFTGKLTEKWRKEKNISIADWKEKTLKDCCRIGSGGTPSRKNPAFYRGDIPWVKTGEINWNELYDTEEHISKEAIDNSSAKLYREGAVLVAMYGMGATRGRAAILRTNATTNQAVCALETKENLLNQFLFYYFMNNYWKIREKAVGGNQLNLSGKIIEKLEVKLPVIEEQQEIVRLLDNLLSREQSTVTACEEALTTIDTLKKSILARAFRGELGTNDPAEPNAKELLKEILSA